MGGASQIFKRTVSQRIRHDESVFTSEDTYFVYAARMAGFKLCISAPLNFVAVRQAVKADHTWRIEDCTLQLSSEASYVGTGDDLSEYAEF